MEFIVDMFSALCLLLGSFLCLSGGIGMIRFPDFYTRMHAAGVTDTLAAAMILVGLMLQIPDTLVILKLFMILLMLLITSPTASHALAQAAFRNDFMPLSNEKKNSTGGPES